MISDAEMCYALNSQVYLGKEGNVAEVGQGQRVVEELSQPYHGSGRNITCDNFFTSVPIAKSMLEKNLTLVGTIRANKRELPPQFLKSRQREEHSSIFGFAENMTVVSYVPQKLRCVNLLSTMHYDKSIDEGEQRKPLIILDYNHTKGSVDVIDQCVHNYTCSRQTRRWPNKIFFNIIDIAALNSFLIWKLEHPEWNSRKNFKRRLYLIELSKDLMQPQMLARSQYKGLHTRVRSVMITCGLPQQNQAQMCSAAAVSVGRCHLCLARRQTRGKCGNCNNFVCVDHCIEENRRICDNCK